MKITRLNYVELVTQLNYVELVYTFYFSKYHRFKQKYILEILVKNPQIIRLLM